MPFALLASFVSQMRKNMLFRQMIGNSESRARMNPNGHLLSAASVKLGIRQAGKRDACQWPRREASQSRQANETLVVPFGGGPMGLAIVHWFRYRLGREVGFCQCRYTFSMGS